MNEWTNEWVASQGHTRAKCQLTYSMILFHLIETSEAPGTLGLGLPFSFLICGVRTERLGDVLCQWEIKCAKNAYNDYSFQCSCLSINTSSKPPTKRTCSSSKLEPRAFGFHITYWDRHAWEWESFGKCRCGSWCGLSASYKPKLLSRFNQGVSWSGPNYLKFRVIPMVPGSTHRTTARCNCVVDKS